MTDDERKADRPEAQDGGASQDAGPEPRSQDAKDVMIRSERWKSMVVMQYQPPPTAEVDDEPGGLPAPEPSAHAAGDSEGEPAEGRIPDPNE
jgi:hypothetical protein